MGKVNINCQFIQLGWALSSFFCVSEVDGFIFMFLCFVLSCTV